MISVISLANDFAIVLMLSLVTVGASYFLDFCFGHPQKEDGPNVHAIFFPWILWLSKRRLKPAFMKKLKVDNPVPNTPENALFHQQIKNQFKSSVVTNAREFITWEHAAGFCIFCTNVWITLFFTLAVIMWMPLHLMIMPIYFLPLLTIFFSHFMLRKIN